MRTFPQSGSIPHAERRLRNAAHPLAPTIAALLQDVRTNAAIGMGTERYKTPDTKEDGKLRGQGRLEPKKRPRIFT